MDAVYDLLRVSAVDCKASDYAWFLNDQGVPDVSLCPGYVGKSRSKVVVAEPVVAVESVAVSNEINANANANDEAQN